MRVIGYVRVSTAKQAGDNSHGLAAQRNSVEKWCQANGHELLTVVPEVASTRNPERMYGRLAVEAALRSGLADAMLVRDLDRATRSTYDGAALLKRANDHGWRIISTDGTDTADPEQEMLTNIRFAVAQEERRKISRRTKEGLAAARRADKVLGRPRRILPATERQIVLLARQGLSAGAIARELTDSSVPTPGGGTRWHSSVVRDVIRRNNDEAVA